MVYVASLRPYVSQFSSRRSRVAYAVCRMSDAVCLMPYVSGPLRSYDGQLGLGLGLGLGRVRVMSPVPCGP